MNSQGAAELNESGTRRARDDQQRFMRAQMEILSSDSVLRKLVKRLGFNSVLLQEQNPDEEEYGVFLSLVHGLRERISGLKDAFSAPETQDFGEELNTQRAVRSFRRRAFVKEDYKSGIIDIHLYGNNRERLKNELDDWLQSYFHRMNEIATETYDSFYSSRMQYWEEVEREAFKAVLAFQQEHPEVTVAALAALIEDNQNLQSLRNELVRELEVGVRMTQRDEVGGRENPDLGALRGRRLSAMIALSEARVVYEEGSDRVTILRERLADIDSEIAKLELEEVAVKVPEVVDNTEERKVELRKQIERLSAQLKLRSRTELAMKARVDELQDLERKHAQFKEYKENYALARRQALDRLDSDQNVRISVVDRPMVSTRPANLRPYSQVFAGMGAGLVIGFLLAVCGEILSSKIRFKSDVAADLSVPVVGVIGRG